eukprot:sb/3465451/
MGLQHETITLYEDRGVPTHIPMLPSRLPNHDSHVIGKWHLGFSRPSFLPTNRGFDSFYGYYSGHITYFGHDNLSSKNENRGHDFRHVEGEGDVVLESERGVHTSILYANRIKKVLERRDKERELFIYLTPGNPHIPYEPPSYMELRYKAAGVRWSPRAGLITDVDDLVGQVLDMLQDHGILNETLVVITNDNGALRGYNGPLRGGKWNMGEGGVRTPTILVHPAFRGGGESNLLSHATDLHVLLARFGRCGVGSCDVISDVISDVTLDGTDILPPLLRGDNPDRYIVINIDQINREGAVRDTRYKLHVVWSRNNTELAEHVADVKHHVSCRLTDLHTDPYERDNLCFKPPYIEIKVRLLEFLCSEIMRSVEPSNIEPDRTVDFLGGNIRSWRPV